MLCTFSFSLVSGNSSLDKDDAVLLSERKNLQNELQISPIRYLWYILVTKLNIFPLKHYPCNLVKVFEKGN